MLPDPPPDATRTVFCQACEAWRHPRHACARNPDHETAPLPVLRLREKGPLVRADFGKAKGGMSPEVRGEHAIAKFDLLAHSAGTFSTFGRTQPVYYLADEHDPAAVIETWLAANEETIAGRGLTTENVTRALENALQACVGSPLCNSGLRRSR